ncbi:MAG: hypothetical protein M3O46_17730 [Myxococcota bacterium]|nr:hypothetical protein [Myxococcota bacterium]
MTAKNALGCLLGHVKPFHLGGLARTLLVVVAVAAQLVELPAVRADDVYLDGTWNMSAVTESFMVQQWGRPCGPPPVSRTVLPAGPVAIRSDQGELVVRYDRHALRTDQCLDPMPTLAREAHTRDARSWRTRCTTPPGDSRRATVNTAFFIAPGNDSISIAETGRYEFTIQNERCVADVKRAGSLSRVVTVSATPSAGGIPVPGAAPIAADKTPLGASKGDCSGLGEPARLEVRPSRKLMRLGETFAFRGVVVDAKGCPTATPIQWTVGPIKFHDGLPHDARPSIDGAGRVTAPLSDFADATFDVVASAAGREARASVEATSGANYEALLAQSGLDSNGERGEPSVAALATSSIGASRARAEDGASRRRTTFIAVVIGLALALGVVAIIGARRARSANKAARAAEARHAQKMLEYDRQKRDREQQQAALTRAHIQSIAIAQQQSAAAAARGIDSGPAFCPSCRREFLGAGGFCPFDANRLIAIAGHEELLRGPPGGICPACKRGFNPGVRVCPQDGEDLLPPSVVSAQAATPSLPARGKICPTCGGHFEGSAGFCVKDGTHLVLLN